MKNSKQKLYYISDSNNNHVQNKNEITKNNNDLLIDGQKFIDFQEPNDVPVNHLYNKTNSNFFKQFENRDLVEYSDEMIKNNDKQLHNNQQHNINVPNYALHDNVQSKYFNNLNFPLKKQENNINYNLKKDVSQNKQKQTNNFISENSEEKYKFVKKTSAESNKETLHSLNSKNSQYKHTVYNNNCQNEQNNCQKEQNHFDLKNLMPDFFSPQSQINKHLNDNNDPNFKLKLQSNNSKENHNRNQHIILSSNISDLSSKTKYSNRIVNDNSNNDNNNTNLNNDLDFLNTLLKLKTPREIGNITRINIDDSKSYIKDDINIRVVTPGKEGDLFFNENISLISHNKSNSNLLNNVSNYQGDPPFKQNIQQRVNSTDKYNIYNDNRTDTNRNINKINDRNENNNRNYVDNPYNCDNNNTNCNNNQKQNQTKINKDDLVEILNKRRKLINGDITSSEGHFRRRHNETQAKLERIRKEKLEKENIEIKNQPTINKKSKEIAEKLFSKNKPNNIQNNKNKIISNNDQNLSNNHVNNNVNYFNYHNDNSLYQNNYLLYNKDQLEINKNVL